MEKERCIDRHFPGCRGCASCSELRGTFKGTEPRRQASSGACCRVSLPVCTRPRNNWKVHAKTKEGPVAGDCCNTSVVRSQVHIIHIIVSAGRRPLLHIITSVESSRPPDSEFVPDAAGKIQEETFLDSRQSAFPVYPPQLQGRLSDGGKASSRATFPTTTTPQSRLSMILWIQNQRRR